MRIHVPTLVKKYPISSVAVICGFVIILTYYLAVSVKQPWESGGRLVVAVRTVPGELSETTLGLGIDDMMLIEQDGDNRKASIRTKRITLTPGSEHFEVLFDMTAPVGEYAGFSFSLKSPEIKNNWEEDIPPTPVSLGGEFVHLATPFRVQKDTTSTIILSFETLQALYEKDGAEVYLPVIQTETRIGASVQVDESGFPYIEGGTINHSATYGMGWDGVMHYNTRAPRDPNTHETTEPQELPVLNTIETQEDVATTTATSTGEHADESAENLSEETETGDAEAQEVSEER